MLIEIFADNLDKFDTLASEKAESCRLIIVMENRIFLWHETSQGLYGFPAREIRSGEDESVCLDKLLADSLCPATGISKALTLVEHFPGRTFISHYYRIDLGAKAGFFTPVSGFEGSWYDPAEALNLLSDYAGNHPYGPEIAERDFIALFNSI